MVVLFGKFANDDFESKTGNTPRATLSRPTRLFVFMSKFN